MSTPESIVIVGGGLAGVAAAGTLRDAGFNGKLVVLSDEPEMPYDRPPLSKGVLMAEELEKLVELAPPGSGSFHTPREIALRPANWYADKMIDLRLGRAAVALDAAAHALTLDDGSTLSYDRLLLTPGARVRKLALIESGAVPVAYLRTLADSMQIREQLKPGARIVLLGGGIIGMEVAASAVQRNCDVTVVELAPRIMARALSPALSDHLAAYHRAKGVKLMLSAQVAGQATGGARGLAMKDGSVVEADMIIAGIGVIPNTELAQQAGLRCNDGIIVDEFGQTSAPDVFAAGDAVRYPDYHFKREMRSENWFHAQNQAIVVAKNMLGAREAYQQVQTMWSDQYDLKIQVTGACETEVPVLRGSMESNSFMYIHLADGVAVGAMSVNQPRDIKFLQKMIENRVPVTADQLRDPEFNLKKAVK